MSNIEKAVELFHAGSNCSQAVFVPYGVASGLPEETCLRLATGFGGGMGRTGGVCGAVSGAIMVLGLQAGQAAIDDKDAKVRTYALVAELMRRFKERNGDAVNCPDLLGCDIGTEEGFAQAVTKNFHTDICPKFVRDAAEIVEKLLAE